MISAEAMPSPTVWYNALRIWIIVEPNLCVQHLDVSLQLAQFIYLFFHLIGDLHHTQEFFTNTNQVSHLRLTSLENMWSTLNYVRLHKEHSPPCIVTKAKTTMEAGKSGKLPDWE